MERKGADKRRLSLEENAPDNQAQKRHRSSELRQVSSNLHPAEIHLPVQQPGHHLQQSKSKIFRPVKTPSQDNQNKRPIEESEPDDALPDTKMFKVDLPDEKETYAASGLKSSLHGTVYQLKLLILFLKRGLNQYKRSFRLATKMDAAEKFDDVVFQYSKESKLFYRALQAKHQQDETQKITANDLLTEKDGEFSLQKYFISYRRIQSKPEFKSGTWEDFTICTNIDFDFDDQTVSDYLHLKKLAKEDLYFERIIESDDVLNIGGERYRFVNDQRKEKRNQIISRLKPLFEKTSDLKRLAKLLAEYVLNKKDKESFKTIGLNEELFKTYHGALAEEVINIHDKKFHDHFLNAPENLSPQTKLFRDTFREAAEACLESQKKLSSESPSKIPRLSNAQLMDKENAFWQEIKKIELNLSDHFGKILKIESNPQLTDAKQLAEEIARLIDISKRKSQVVVKIIRNKPIIVNNIDKLAGYVLIKKDEKIHFSTTFLNKDQLLSDHFKDLRNHLKTALVKKGVSFDTLDQYQFHIADFQTCKEEELQEHLNSKPTLPDDSAIYDREIEDFLNKLVFAVNQPNEEKLGEIINKEIGQEFNLIDADLITNDFQKKMWDWLKEKQGTYLSENKAHAFFEEGREKIAKLVLIGPTSEHSRKIRTLGITFKKVPQELIDFLTSEKEKQIFNFIASQDTKLGAIKVDQTLQALPDYQKEDSYIFVPSHSLLLLKDRAVKAFRSKMSNHLLVIEYKAEGNTQGLYKELSEIIEKQPSKKIILITKPNNILIDDFKRHAKYEEKVDKIKFSDLTPDSQSALLKTTVNFQGRLELLNRLLGIDDPNQLTPQVLDAFGTVIDGSTVVQLIKKQLIAIGGEPLRLSSLEAVYIKRYEPITPEHLVDALENKQTLFVISISGQTEISKQILIERFKIADAEKRSRIASKIGTLIDSNNSNNSEENTIFILSGRDRDNHLRDFKQVCYHHPHHKVHWIEITPERFIWQQFYDPNFYVSRHFNRPVKVVIKPEVKQQLIAAESDDLWVISGFKQATSLSDLSSMFKKIKEIRPKGSEEKDKSLQKPLLIPQKSIKPLKRPQNPTDSPLAPFDLPSASKKAEKTFEQMAPDYPEADNAELKEKEKIDALQQQLLAMLTIPEEQAAALKKNIDQGTVILAEQEETAKREFNRLIEQHPKKSVHWLQVAQGFINQQLIWQHSHGTLDKLRPYIDADNRKLSSIAEQELMTEISLTQSDNQRLKIITGEPGMGKSTTLAHLSEQISESKAAWIIPLALKDCQRAIESLSLNSLGDTEQGITEVIRFLLKAGALGSESALTDHLLRHALTHSTPRSPLLLLDGFDEIEPAFQRHHPNIPEPEHTPREKIVRLLQFIKQNTQAHLWVSTKKSQTEVLENGLSRFAIEFKTFSPAEQQRFLQDFWQSHLRLKYALNELTTFAYQDVARALINKANQVLGETISRFIGIPLQVRILAEVYQAEFEQHRLPVQGTQLDTLFNDLEVCNLYQRFIDTKYEIYLREKSAVESQSNREILKAHYAKAHEQLALKLLFPEQAEKLLTTEQEEQIADDTLVRIGIVQLVNSKLEFLHRTFAEYFITTGLERQLKKPQIAEAHSLLIDILMQPDYQALHLFLNSHLIRQLLTDNKLLEQFREQIQRLWSNGNFYNKEGETAIHIAARAGNSVIINFFSKSLHNHPKLLEVLEATTPDNVTPLHLAALHGHFKAVKLLIEKRANIEAVAKNNQTPLHLATMNGHLEVVKLLIEKGAKIEIVDKNNWTPLHLAAFHGHTEIVKLLIDNGIQIEAANKDNKTPLHLAAQKGHVETVKLLIERGAQIEAVDQENQTPLHWAISKGHIETVGLLIEHGAQIEAVNKDNWSSLHGAAEKGYLEIVKLLIEKGAQIEVVTKVKMTPLHLAAYKGHLDIVNFLIEKSAKIEAVAENHLTPLHWAAHEGHLEVVKLLIEKGAQIEAVEENHLTSFHWAAHEGHLEVVKLLIEKGAQIEAVEENHLTPLHWAAHEGHLEVVKLLIEKGAQIEAVEENHLTSFHWAAQEGHLEVVKLLIDSGAQIEAVDKNNRTPLYMAAYQGHTETVKVLIDNGANMEAISQYGSTPLHVAAQKGHVETVKLLIERGAQIEAVDQENQTTLHYQIFSKSLHNHPKLLELESFSKYSVKLTQNININNSNVKVYKVNGKSYQVLNTIDEGGSCQVYQVYDSVQQEIFALKIVDLQCIEHLEEVVNSYRNEIDILINLRSCKCVVHLYDSEYRKSEKKLLMLMEKGDSNMEIVLNPFVADENEAKAHDSHAVKFFFRGMVKAVDEIHKHNVVHTDLKPQNFILINGNVKLIDFGISSVILENQTSIYKEDPIGTIDYLSPETLTLRTAPIYMHKENKVIKYNCKTDIWSLGCILYDMASGCTPFQHCRNKLKAIKDQNYKIDYSKIENQQLVDCIKKCLEHDQTKRPTASELLQHPYLV